MEKNRQGFSPNFDQSLKIEAERSFVRFLIFGLAQKSATAYRFFNKLMYYLQYGQVDFSLFLEFYVIVKT